MSEIQRYMYARDGMVPDAEHLRGSGEPEFWVRFTDHEAAIEQVLADVKARIEGALVDLTDRHDDDPYLKGYRIARRDALAALTQKGEA